MVLKTCRLLLLFSFSLLVRRAVAEQSEQVPLQLEKRRLITKDFSKHVRKLLDEGSVKGLSLVVVKANEGAAADVELGSWGVKTEDGDGVDSKVCSVLDLKHTNFPDYTSPRHCLASGPAPKRSWLLRSAFSWKTMRPGRTSHLYLLELRSSTGNRSLSIFFPENGS